MGTGTAVKYFYQRGANLQIENKHFCQQQILPVLRQRSYQELRKPGNKSEQSVLVHDGLEDQGVVTCQVCLYLVQDAALH